MVLFVLGIVYVILFFMAAANSGKRLVKYCTKNASTLAKVFVCFYWSILVQIVLSDSLYWVYFVQMAGVVSISTDELVRAIALVFLPTILMIISYSLMFF